jgi:hypothetical protein
VASRFLGSMWVPGVDADAREMLNRTLNGVKVTDWIFPFTDRYHGGLL